MYNPVPRILLMLFIGLFLVSGIFAQAPKLVVPTGLNNSKLAGTLASPDGHLLYTITANGNVKCFDIKSGLELRSYGGGDGAQAMILSPNGKTLVIIGKNYSVYDAQTTRKLAEVTYSLGSSASSFLDNENFFTLPYGGGILLFNQRNWGSPVIVKDRAPRKIILEKVATSPDGQYLAATYWHFKGDIKKMGIWKLGKTPQWKAILMGTIPAQYIFPLKYENEFGGTTGSVVFSEDSKTLLNKVEARINTLGNPGFTAQLFDPASGRASAVYNAGRDNPMLVTNDGKLLLATESGLELRGMNGAAIWNNGDHVTNYNTVFPINNVAIKGQQVYFPLKSGAVALAGLADGRVQKKLGDGGAQGERIALSADKRWMAISMAGARVAIWDMKYGRMVNTFLNKDPDNKIIKLSFSAHGERLLILKKGPWPYIAGTVEVIDTKTGTSLAIAQTKNDEEYGLADISPAGDLFVYHGTARSIDIYSITEKRVIRSEPTVLLSFVKFGADGKYIFFYDNNYQDKEKAGVMRMEPGGVEVRRVTESNGFYGDMGMAANEDVLAIGNQASVKLLTRASTNLKGTLPADPFGSLVGLSASGQKLATGDLRSGAIAIFESNTGKMLARMASAHGQKITGLEFPNEDLLASVSADTHTKLWATNGKLMGEFYVLGDNDWIFSTPDGRFDGSAAGMKKIYYVQGNQPIPLDNLYEKFYTPGLLAKVINGGQAPTPEVDVNTLALPPRVKMTFDVARNLIVANDVAKINWTNEAISVSVKADCTENSIDEIRLYLNGKLISSSTRNLTVVDDKNDKTLTRTFTLKLTPGNNSFKAIAFNKQRTESIPDETDVVYTPAASQPVVQAGSNVTLHLMVIGINNYKNAKYNLNYAKADAAAFKEEMEQGNNSIFAKTKVYFITDGEALRSGIEDTFNKVIADAKPQDIFIFYYAGHGVMSSEGIKDFYIVPYDVTQLYGAEDALAQKGISSKQLQEFSRKIPAQKQLFILDACQSAGALEAMGSRGAAEEKAIAQLARSTGTHWLTASGSEQFATEFAQLGHGVFTYALLQGLSGAAANGTRQVTINQLKAYLEVQVPELSQKYKGTAQYPASYGFGNDFPLMIVK